MASPVDLAESTVITPSAPHGSDEPARTLLSDAWHDLRRNPVFWISALLIVVVVAMAAFPGLFTGNQSFSESSKFFGGEFNYGCVVCCGCNYSVSVYGGFRFLELEESLTLDETLQGTPNAPAPFTNARTDCKFTFQRRFVTL